MHYDDTTGKEETGINGIPDNVENGKVRTGSTSDNPKSDGNEPGTEGEENLTERQQTEIAKFDKS